MTPKEFVTKTLTDKKYLIEVCRHIPDEMIKEQQPEANDDLSEEEKAIRLGSLFAKYFGAAAQDMGLGFGEDDIRDESIEQFKKMGFMKKLSFTVRFAKSLNKAGKAGK